MNRDPHNDPARTTHEAPEPCTCEDDASNPEERALRKQLEDRVGAALMTLTRTDRLAFLLAAEGWTSGEIARHFSMTSDSVRSRLKRARKKLRDLLVTHDARGEALRGTNPEEQPCPRSPP